MKRLIGRNKFADNLEVQRDAKMVYVEIVNNAGTVSQSVCLSVCAHAPLFLASLSAPFCPLSVSLSLCSDNVVSICPPALSVFYLSIYLFDRPSVCLPVIPVFLSVFFLSLCLFPDLSVSFSSVCLSVYLSLFLLRVGTGFSEA